MSPLVALLLFGFMFVIALSLTIWAALTLGDGRRLAEDEDNEVSYVPLSGSHQVWRRDDAAKETLAGIERRGQQSVRRADGRRDSDRAPRSTGLPAVSPQAAVPVTPSPRWGDAPADPPAAQVTVRSHKSNDEYRGARATVTQRPNNDDAFERFLENNRD